VNRAVGRAEARPPRWTPEGAVTADIRSPRDSAAYRITLGGATLARGTVPPDSIAPSPVEVHSSPAVRGWVAGTVELEPDELRGDDARHFVVWVGPPPAATADPSAGAFARGALDALVQSRRAVAGGGITIVAADRLTRMPALILAPAEPVRAGAANRALERAGIPWRFGDVRRGATAISGDRLAGVRADLRYALTLVGAAATDTLARAGSEPWAVAGAGYVLLASPLDPSATDLPLRAAFVPWLGDLLAQRLMAGDAAGSVLSATPGSAVAPLGDGIDALEFPDGSHRAVPAVGFAAPDEPGVYFLLHGARRAGALVVDPEPDESELARLGGTALAARFTAREVRVLDDPARWRAEVMLAGGRRPIAVPLLVLALLALAAESALTRAGGGARRARAEAAA
jgi:hypothetical protein